MLLQSPYARVCNYVFVPQFTHLTLYSKVMTLFARAQHSIFISFRSYSWQKVNSQSDAQQHENDTTPLIVPSAEADSTQTFEI